jgi:hypothetical protein
MPKIFRVASVSLYIRCTATRRHERITEAANDEGMREATTILLPEEY